MNTFIRKISSRKLWTAIAGVVVGLAALFGADEGEWTAVAGVVGAVASCISYIIGESKIDAARESAKDYVEEEGVYDCASPIVGTSDPEAGGDVRPV